MVASRPHAASGLLAAAAARAASSLNNNLLGWNAIKQRTHTTKSVVATMHALLRRNPWCLGIIVDTPALYFVILQDIIFSFSSAAICILCCCKFVQIPSFDFRNFLPSLEEFFETAIEQADPAGGIEEEYKSVCCLCYVDAHEAFLTSVFWLKVCKAKMM